jgi:hypothetical protein
MKAPNPAVTRRVWESTCISRGQRQEFLVDYGQSLTRGSIWLALSLYVAAEAIRLNANSDSSRPHLIARALNAVGFAFFLVHVGCAFQFYHHWSQAAAYADTARQTNEYFGVNWGGGLYWNYAFLLLWLGQVIRSWTRVAGVSHKMSPLGWLVRAFALIMIFNGAFIFAHGPVRWFGLLLNSVLIWSWWPGDTMRQSSKRQRNKGGFIEEGH